MKFSSTDISPYRGSFCVIEHSSLPKTTRINCVKFKGIGKQFPAEIAIVPVLWLGLIKIRESEVLGCHRLLKYATDVHKHVSEVMYGSRILNNASDADSTPLMC